MGASNHEVNRRPRSLSTTREFKMVECLSSRRTASNVWHDLSRCAIGQFSEEQGERRLDEVAFVGRDDNVVLVEELAESTVVIGLSD